MTNTATHQDSLTRRIAVSSLALKVADIAPEALTYTKSCLADAIGIGFASHYYDFAERTVAGVRTLASPGAGVVIGLQDTLAPRDAALLNGTLIHGLDFDDTHLASVVHCSASALPTALALASERSVSGTDLLLACIIATEVDARLGSAAGGTFQQLGFHPTGVVGIFGATVAAVRLLGGTVEEAIRAQGIALSMAGGSMAFLDTGTWTKRLHPGWAAQSALAAAKLALAGFEAPPEAYAGRYGFYALFTQNADNVNNVDWSRAYQDLAMNSVAIKPYPICHFNHAPVDAALHLRAKHGLRSDQIESITIGLHERQFAVVVEPVARKQRPESEYEAKFSVAYAVATALVRGQLGLRELELESRTDEAILALTPRIHCVHDDRSNYPKTFSGGVSIKMRDGTVYEHFDTVNRGAEGRLLSVDDVKTKFVQNCRLVLSEARTEAVWEAIMDVDKQDDCSALLDALKGLGDPISIADRNKAVSRSATC